MGRADRDGSRYRQQGEVHTRIRSLQQPEQHRWMQNMPRGWASTGKASQTWTTTRFLSCALNVNPTLVESAVFNTLATSLAFFPLEICLLA
jgi:hypothetical protein